MENKKGKITEGKREKTYWGVRESLLDKGIIVQIQKTVQVVRVSALCSAICCCLLFLIMYFQRSFSLTAFLVISGVVIVAVLSVLVIVIVFAVKLLRLKKRVQKTQVGTHKSSILPETEASGQPKETNSNNSVGESKNKETLLIVFTILSVLLFIFGLLHIPILSLMGVQFPARNFLWFISIIPTVIVSAIPLIICIYFWIK